MIIPDAGCRGVGGFSQGIHARRSTAYITWNAHCGSRSVSQQA